jgi:hypothetical protein
VTSFTVKTGRKAYILQVEGRSHVSNQFNLEEGDAATVQGPEEVQFDIGTKSMLLVLEMEA